MAEIKSTHKDLPKVEGRPQPEPQLMFVTGWVGERVWVKACLAGRLDLVQWYGEFTKEEALRTSHNLAEAARNAQ